MDVTGEHLIRAAIDVGGLLPNARAALQRMGDEAFIAISGELDQSSLDSSQRVNALRALSLISASTENMPLRKDEVLERALTMSTSDDRVVRSAAVHVGIWTAAMLEDLGRPAPKERMGVVIRKAIRLGLDPAVVKLAQGFLRGEAPPVDIIEIEVRPPHST